MVKTKQQRALTILIFTALAVAVGCGDGKRNSRGKVDRASGAQAKPVDGKTATTGTGLNKTADGSNGGAAVPGSTTGGTQTDAKAAQERTEGDAKIDSIYNTYVGYTKSDLQSLPAGKYKLEGSLSTLLFGPKNAHIVRGVQTFSLEEGNRLVAGSEAAYYGALNDTDGGRNLQIPGEFTLTAGQPYKIVKQSSDWLYMTKLTKTNGTLKLVDNVTTLEAARSSGSLADLLAGKGTDDLGKTATVTIVKVGADKVRFILTFNELGSAAKASDALENSRIIVLTYRLVAADTSAPAGAGATTDTGAIPDVDAQ